MKRKNKTHKLHFFLAGCAKTMCGIYAESEDVTAHGEITCKNCKRIDKKQKEFWK